MGGGHMEILSKVCGFHIHRYRGQMDSDIYIYIRDWSAEDFGICKFPATNPTWTPGDDCTTLATLL